MSGMFSWLISVLVSIFSWFWAELQAWWIWAYTFAVSWWLDLSAWALDRLPEGVQEWVNAHPWEDWYGILDDISWVVPVYPVLVIALTTYAFVGAIRVGRWVLSFLPTLNAG